MERNKGQNSRGGSNSRTSPTPKKANASNKTSVSSKSASTGKATKQKISASPHGTSNRGLTSLDDDREIGRKNVKRPSGGARGSNSGGARGNGRTSR